MKICPQCTRQVVDDFRFCSDCGFDFQNSGDADNVQKISKIPIQKHQVKKVKQVRMPAPPPPEQPQPQVMETGQVPYQSYPQAPSGGIDYREKAEEEYGRGDYYSALDSYKLAVLNNPGDFNLVMAKERLLEMLNHKIEAVESLDEALKIQPENRDLWETKSRLLLMLFHEKGEHHFKKESDLAMQTAEDLKSQLIAKGLCPSCNGAGNCQKCHGTGSCHECGGTGVYKGVVKCQFCNGTGKCDRCLGSSKCSDCKGSGKLEISDCQYCHGNGLCGKCHGTGKHLIGHCKECDGTGYCRHCKGKGKIVDMPRGPRPPGK